MPAPHAEQQGEPRGLMWTWTQYEQPYSSSGTAQSPVEPGDGSSPQQNPPIYPTTEDGPTPPCLPGAIGERPQCDHSPRNMPSASETWNNQAADQSNVGCYPCVSRQSALPETFGTRQTRPLEDSRAITRDPGSHNGQFNPAVNLPFQQNLFVPENATSHPPNPYMRPHNQPLPSWVPVIGMSLLPPSENDQGDPDISSSLSDEEDLFGDSEEDDDNSYQEQKSNSLLNKIAARQYDSAQPDPHGKPSHNYGVVTSKSEEIASDQGVEIYANESSDKNQDYFGNPQGKPSPTESQLERIGFEFHTDLSEDQPIQRFGRAADVSAINKIEPQMPRKQQWHVFESTQQPAGEDGDDFDDERDAFSEDGFEGFTKMLEKDEDEQNLGQTRAEQGQREEHQEKQAQRKVGGGCACHWNGSKCKCALGRCICTRRENHGPAAERACGCEGDFSKYKLATDNCHCPSRGNDEGDDHSVLMDIGETPITPTFKIPSLRTVEQDSPPIAIIKSVDVNKENFSEDVAAYQPDRLFRAPLGALIKRITDENDVDNYHPNSLRSPVKNGRRRDRSSTGSPLRTPPRVTPVDEFIRRPDIPRPFDDSVRQSVEPREPPHWFRDSTPAYEDRSPSPSPISNPGDIDMQDITPKMNRHGSAPPPPTHASGNPTSANASHSPVRLPRPAPLLLSRTPAQLARQNSGQPLSRSFFHQPNDHKTYDQQQQQFHKGGPNLPSNVYEPPAYSPLDLSPQHPQDSPDDSPLTPLPPSPPKIPPIPTNSAVLNVDKNRKGDVKGRRKSTTNAGVSKPKSRSVTQNKSRATKDKSTTQKKKQGGMVGAAVQRLEEQIEKGKLRKELEIADRRAIEDAEKGKELGKPLRRSGRMKNRNARLSGEFADDE